MKQFFSTLFMLALSSVLFGQGYPSTLNYEIARGVGEDTLKIYISNNTGTDQWLGGAHWGVKLSSSSADVSGVPEIVNDDLNRVLNASFFLNFEYQEYSDTDISVIPPQVINSVTIDGVVYDRRLDYTTAPGFGVTTLFLVPGDGAAYHLLDFVIPRKDANVPVDMILEASDDVNNSFFTNSFGPVGDLSVNTTDYDVAPLNASFPVELLDFDAYQVGEGTVQLDWTTATEKNNAEFQVERSVDGNFFTRIASVEGAGNSDSPRFYEYMDFSAPTSRIYYRLRQVDFDGSFQYSSVREVKLGQTFAPRFDVYPNPARDHINIEGTVSSERNLRIRVLDISGRVMIQKDDVSLGENTLKIDVSGLSPAKYILEVMDLREELGHSEAFIVVE